MNIRYPIYEGVYRILTDKQPPFEIRVLVVTFFVKHCLEQGILQQVFRLLPVSCQFVRKTEQFVLYAK